MFTEVFLPPLVGLLPVICFLAVLLFLDSYKLVRLPVVVAIVCCGVVVAGASYLIGAVVLSRAGIGLIAYSRYVAPFAEELLKGLVIVALVRAHRIGFSSMRRSSASPSAPASPCSRTSTSCAWRRMPAPAPGSCAASVPR